MTEWHVDYENANTCESFSKIKRKWLNFQSLRSLRINKYKSGIYWSTSVGNPAVPVNCSFSYIFLAAAVLKSVAAGTALLSLPAERLATKTYWSDSWEGDLTVFSFCFVIFASEMNLKPKYRNTFCNDKFSLSKKAVKKESRLSVAFWIFYFIALHLNSATKSSNCLYQYF